MKYLLIIIIFITLAIAGFKIRRWFNWNFQYKSSVEETIREIVKPNCLIGAEEPFIKQMTMAELDALL